jgi:hypothetical protein
MKVKTKVTAGGRNPNHNETFLPASRSPMKVKTRLKPGDKDSAE